MDGTPQATMQCALCHATAPAEGLSKINNQPVCASCRKDIETELKAQQQLSASDLPKAVLLSSIGAVLGAALWCTAVVITKMEVGYVAIGIGYLAGKGATFGTKARGGAIQIIAAAAALAGLVLGKYAVCWYVAANAIGFDKLGGQVFSVQLAIIAASFFMKSVNAFDLIWIVITLRVAWRLSAPSRLRTIQAK